MAVGAAYVREIAAKKLGKQQAADWERTPNPALEDGIAPVALLDSGCPSCISSVLDVLEGMPDGD